ncbi:interaptin-like [Ruditapes philippinarum]|uniref:interaptin-like n=1 Tax=Ruditapes philippinarum TaxID=129788 RepID=UPI00295BDEDD|nr:interaptin-like [Ruditapes philippinarum]
MASKDTECTTMNLQFAIARLLVFAKKAKNPCFSDIDVLAEEIKEELKKENIQKESHYKKVKEMTDDLDNVRFQLHIVSKSKKDLDLELLEVRHMNYTLEKKYESIVEENTRLNEMAEQLEIKNSVLEDSHIKEIKKLAKTKEKEIQFHTTERTRLKSYISDLEIRTKNYQDRLIAMKLKVEGEVQEKDRKMHQLQVHLQEKMKLITQQDEIITSNERKIIDQCAEIDHFREKIKYMVIKNDFSIEKEHEISKIREGKLIESEEQLKSIHNENCQLKTIHKELENELKKKEDELNKRETECDQIFNKMKESDKQVNLMQEKIQELERVAVKNNQTKTDTERQLEDLNERYNILLSEKDRNISKLNEKMVLSNRTISDLKETETSFTLHQMNREDHISMLNDKLKQFTNLVNKNESKVQDMEKILHKEKNEFDNKLQFYEKEIARKGKMAVDINDRMGQMESHAIALGKEVKEKDAKIDALNAQLQQFQKHQDESQKNLEIIINSNQKLILDLKKDVEQRDSKISSLEKKIAQILLENLTGGEHKIDAALTNEIKDLKRQLKLTMSKLHDTKADLYDTKTRLNQVMVDRLTDNERNITDLSDKNRPTKLAEKCAELYDNQWTDAFKVLETYFANDEAVIEALLHILKATMTFCEDKAKFQIEELGKVVIFADTHVSANMPHGVQKHLKNTRQTMALSAVENLSKMFISHLKQSTDQTVQKALEIKEFAFACLELCWFMMVNNPPVAFAPVLAKGSDFNSDLYKPYSYGGTHIDYVVWPALLLHEGGPILGKGVAQGYNS